MRIASTVLALVSLVLATRAAAQPPALARATQLVVVTTPDWNATTGTLRRYERRSSRAAWTPVGDAVPIVVGRSGLAWDASLGAPPERDAPVKHEGDGRSPAGAFPLTTAFGFAARDSMTWAHLPYHPLTDGTDCVDDTTSIHYNRVVDRTPATRVDWSSAEHMRRVPEYRLGIVVGYNATPPRRGRGSCIFLHIWDGPSSTTSGCTAMSADRLEDIVHWLDAKRHPVLVQLTSRAYEQERRSWRLP